MNCVGGRLRGRGTKGYVWDWTKRQNRGTCLLSIGTYRALTKHLRRIEMVWGGRRDNKQGLCGVLPRVVPWGVCKRRSLTFQRCVILDAKTQ